MKNEDRLIEAYQMTLEKIAEVVGWSQARHGASVFLLPEVVQKCISELGESVRKASSSASKLDKENGELVAEVAELKRELQALKEGLPIRADHAQVSLRCSEVVGDRIKVYEASAGGQVIGLIAATETGVYYETEPAEGRLGRTPARSLSEAVGQLFTVSFLPGGADQEDLDHDPDPVSG